MITMVHMWRSEDNLKNSDLSFHHVGRRERCSNPQDWQQVLLPSEPSSHLLFLVLNTDIIVNKISFKCYLCLVSVARCLFTLKWHLISFFFLVFKSQFFENIVQCILILFRPLPQLIPDPISLFYPPNFVPLLKNQV